MPSPCAPMCCPSCSSASRARDLPFDIGALHTIKRRHASHCFTMFPNLAIQDAADSDIGSSTMFFREARKIDNIYRWHLPDYGLAAIETRRAAAAARGARRQCRCSGRATCARQADQRHVARHAIAPPGPCRDAPWAGPGERSGRRRSVRPDGRQQGCSAGPAARRPAAAQGAQPQEAEGARYHGAGRRPGRGRAGRRARPSARAARPQRPRADPGDRLRRIRAVPRASAGVRVSAALPRCVRVWPQSSTGICTCCAGWPCCGASGSRCGSWPLAPPPPSCYVQWKDSPFEDDSIHQVAAAAAKSTEIDLMAPRRLLPPLSADRGPVPRRSCSSTSASPGRTGGCLGVPSARSFRSSAGTCSRRRGRTGACTPFA